MATAGRVDFPTHMKDIHKDWLNQYDDGNDDIDSSMTDVMNAALGNSPYGALAALDPSTELGNMDTAVAAFNTRVDAIDPDGDWQDAVDTAVSKADANVFSTTRLDTLVTEFGDLLDDQIENIVLPRFQGGMRDVNAVMSSAFVLGEGIIEGMRNNDVAKFSAELYSKLDFQRNDFILKGAEAILRDSITQAELEKTVAHYTIEANRLRIVAEKEQKDTDNSITISDGRWDLEIFQYGANLLGAIGGGAVIPRGSNSPSAGQSALGGALAGASIGANAGGGWGALIGGALGGLAGGLF